MCRSRHYPDWRNAVLPDIITVQITGGNVIDDFAADGQLAKAIPGFKPREPQRQMAVAVSEAIEASRPLVVEAGTGTGKTYAYGACAAGEKKVIISTGSKALQDQLYSRDLPTVAKALKFTGKLALLKGRSNYLCLERLEQQALAGGDLPVQTLSDVILLRSGRIKLRMAISAPAPASRKTLRRPLVTSTNDNCLGSDCPLYKDCFVVKARKKRWTPTWWWSTITCFWPIWWSKRAALPS